MLYLITGGMGAGKTLFTLKWVRELQLSSGRPVCYTKGKDGDTILRLKGDGLTWGWQEIDFKDWRDQPDGTIFLVDECHEVMPVRGMGAKATPDHIEALARHRHRGFDFFLIDQHPKNIDSFVRRLIADPGWHRHMKRRAASKFVAQLEWPAVNEKCEKLTAGKTASVTHLRYPVEYFDVYESASIHTAKFRIPKQLYFIGAALITVPALIAGVIYFLRGPDEPAAATAAPIGQIASGAAAQFIPSLRRDEQSSVPMTAEQYAHSLTPRFPDYAYTAPRYDEITTPKKAPYPAACVTRVSDSSCKCFTQDATPYHISKAACMRIAAEGLFIDWQETASASSSIAPAAPVAAPAESSAAPVKKKPELVEYEMKQQEGVDRHLQQIALSAGARANQNPP